VEVRTHEGVGGRQIGRPVAGLELHAWPSGCVDKAVTQAGRGAGEVAAEAAGRRLDVVVV
jgi:hypothetical protein